MWKQLKPNLHSTFETFGSIVPLLAQGEIWLAFGPSRMANTFIVKGAPVERAEVKEGAFLGNQAMVLVNHPKLQPLGRDLINRLLAPEVQTEFSRVVGTGPTNRRTEVPSELTSLVPLGEAEAERLIRLDWSYASQQHAGWLDRWHREISG
jgi:spermidine/putrescine-binding protein